MKSSLKYLTHTTVQLANPEHPTRNSVNISVKSIYQYCPKLMSETEQRIALESIA